MYKSMSTEILPNPVGETEHNTDSHTFDQYDHSDTPIASNSQYIEYHLVYHINNTHTVGLSQNGILSS